LNKKDTIENTGHSN